MCRGHAIDAPHQRYYTACIGSWRSPLDLRIIDRSALWASPRSRIDTLSLELVALLHRLPGFALSTTVRRVDPLHYVHTTRMHWGPITLMASTEDLHLEADGQGLRMTGEVRAGLSHSRLDSTARVAADAHHASYSIDWLGETLVQHTTLSDDGDLVVLDQQGEGWEGRQHLARQPE